ncbi:MAG: hypothetical protein ACF788_12170 [Novipirellula sp. JB048]
MANPSSWGELNLVLIARFGVDRFPQLDVRVRQATAALLVRRHLALRSLHQQGGEALTRLVERQMAALQQELKRRGSDLQQYARERHATERSVRDDLDFKVSWGRYLQSRLSEANLRRFFESRKSHYGGGRWEVSQLFVDAEASDPAAVDAIAQRLRERVQAIRCEVRSGCTWFSCTAWKRSRSPSRRSRTSRRCVVTR